MFPLKLFFHFNKLAIYLLFVFVPTLIYCQTQPFLFNSTIGAMSGFYTIENQNFYSQNCIGQSSPIGLIDNSQFVARQGFIQSFVFPLFINLNAENTDLNLTVYPNPFSDLIEIVPDSKIKEKAFINIYDVNGRLVLFQKFSSNEKLQINASNLSDGFYLLELNMDNKKNVKRILKEKI
jgi:hypothetical protein